MPRFLGTSIAILVGIGSAAAVSADSAVVMDVIVGQGYFHSMADFVTNGEAERAWIEAAVDNGGLGDDYRRETFRVKVPGLSYETRAQRESHRFQIPLHYPDAGREYRSLQTARPARAQNRR